MFKIIHDCENMSARDFTAALEHAKQKIIATALNDVPTKLNEEGKEEKREAKNMAMPPLNLS